jgi:hypothetical protein
MASRGNDGTHERRHVVATAVAACGVLGVVIVGSAMGGGREGSTPRLGAGASAPSAAARFTCPELNRVFTDKVPSIADLAEQSALRDRVRATSWSGFSVEVIEPTHLGLIALVTGDVAAAQRELGQLGVRHVHDRSVFYPEIDQPQDQIDLAIEWLLEPASNDVRRRLRGIAGAGDPALWQKAGALVLQWKRPVPAEVLALAGRRPDGITIYVDPVRFSTKELNAARDRLDPVLAKRYADGIDFTWSQSGNCADNSGIQIGVVPSSLGDQRAQLQIALSKAAGVPVQVLPAEPMVPL